MTKLKKVITLFVLLCVIGFWGFVKYKIAIKQASQEASGKCVLYLYSYTNYFPNEVLKKFEKENSCYVQYDVFSSNEELLAKLQAGASGYDVVVAADYIVKALVAGNLINTLDKSKLPNYKNISKLFLNMPYDLDNLYTVPYKWGTTGFIYNTKYVHENLESWEQVFKPAYKGKISLLDDQREAIGNQLQFLGYSINSTSQKELNEARDLLKQRKPFIKLFSSDPRQVLLLGEVWISHIYSGDATQIIKENPGYKYVIGREGGIVWVDTLAIPTHSHHKDMAYKFINFILSQDAEAMLVKSLQYSSPNETMESLDINANLKPSSLKKLDLRKFEFMKDLGIDMQKWDQIWTEIKSQ